MATNEAMETRTAPLPTLLSQTLIAYTIEFDNEWELQIMQSKTRPRFLVSLPFWENFLRLVPDDGISIGELAGRAGIPTDRLHWYLATERWGCISVEGPEGARPKRTGHGQAIRPRLEWVIRLTREGVRANAVWEPLHDVIEDRWRERFGEDAVAALASALGAIEAELNQRLPNALPVVGPATGMRVHVPEFGHEVAITPADTLSAALARVLLAFTIEYERQSDLSLALSANFLRVLDGADVAVRDLPRATGLSKEAASMSVGFLIRRKLATFEADPTKPRTKLVRLTQRGADAALAHRSRVADVEDGWRTRLGARKVGDLRRALDAVLTAPGRERPALSDGLVPPPTGWRAWKQYVAKTEAFVADPLNALPHHPMVLHRGGWPDGN
jgi:DNA-binding MarR family transcriptional regulator